MSENPELDKVLHAQDLKLAINEFFQDKIGSEPPKAELASRSLADNFKLVGTSLMFGDKLARDAIDDVTAHLKRQGYDFLLPSETPDLDRTAVDPTLLDRAFIAHKPDSRAEVFRRVGKDQVKFDQLAQSYGLDSAADYKTRGVKPGAPDTGGDKSKSKNPWSAESWDSAKQTALVRQIGFKAASEIAASAGSFIGATRPGAKPLIPRRRAS